MCQYCDMNLANKAADLRLRHALLAYFWTPYGQLFNITKLTFNISIDGNKLQTPILQKS